MRGDTGATLVEIAILLPLVLVFIGFVLWQSLMWNATSSLNSAMLEAMRLSSTRAQLTKLSTGVPLTDRFTNRAWENYASFGDLLPNAFHDQFLVAGAPATGVFAQYSNPFTSFDEVELTYRTLIVYLAQALKLSLGGTARFPCPVEDTGNPSDEFGCIACRLLNPHSLNPPLAYSDPPAPEDPFNPPAELPFIPRDRFYLECRYKVDSVLTRIVSGSFAALGIEIGDAFVLSRSLYFRQPLLTAE